MEHATVSFTEGLKLYGLNFSPELVDFLKTEWRRLTSPVFTMCHKGAKHFFQESEHGKIAVRIQRRIWAADELMLSAKLDRLLAETKEIQEQLAQLRAHTINDPSNRGARNDSAGTVAVCPRGLPRGTDCMPGHTETYSAN